MEKNIGIHLIVRLGVLAGKYPECGWLHEFMENQVKSITALPAEIPIEYSNPNNEYEFQIPEIKVF